MPVAPTPKSCITCPSFLNREQARARLGKDIGSAMCSRYGYVLSSPKSPNPPKSLVEAIGTKCKHHGEKWTQKRYDTPDDKPRMVVALPDPTLLQAHTERGEDDTPFKVDSCSACINYISPQDVNEKTDWQIPMCGIKGKLLAPTRLRVEAAGCEYNTFARSDMPRGGDDIQLTPMYAMAFDPTYRSTKLTAEAREGAKMDPTTYATDKEVTEEDDESGIRAWRRVPDPDGGTGVVYLPIFKTDHFDVAEQAKIPKHGDDEHPELYVDHFGGVYFVAVAWTELDETPALFGEAGTGKTELYRHLAYLMNMPFERISITASTELDDLAGKMMYSPEEGTYFQYGRFSLGWGKPNVLCIDEPNTGPLDVWQFLRPTFDNSKQLVLDVNKGERLSRHTDCYPGLAMNPAWDTRNIGALSVADADVNRLFHMAVELPPSALERNIIAERVRLDGWELDANTLNSIMKVAEELRKMSESGVLGVSWALRPQIKVARALRWFSPVMAYRRAIGDFLDTEQRQSVLDVVKANF